MKKKSILFSIIVIAVLIAISAVIIVSAAGNKKPDGQTVIDVEKYWQRRQSEEIFKTPKLSDIYAAAKEICEAGEIVTIKHNQFSDDFVFQAYSEDESMLKSATSADGYITLDFTDKPADERDIYLVFISSLNYGFFDNMFYPDYDYLSKSYNRNRTYLLLFMPDKNATEFDTVWEYCLNAEKEGKRWSDKIDGADQFIIYFDHAEINRLGSDENYYEALKNNEQF